jgi:hypothetical protein
MLKSEEKKFMYTQVLPSIKHFWCLIHILVYNTICVCGGEHVHTILKLRYRNFIFYLVFFKQVSLIVVIFVDAYEIELYYNF